MQHDAAYRALDPYAELEQPLAQGRNLCALAIGADGRGTQHLHQHIGGSGEQDTKLVGPESRATGTVDLQAVMQLLDAVLDLATLAIDVLVEVLGARAQVGDHKACIVAWLASLDAHHFCFDDHAPLM